MFSLERLLRALVESANDGIYIRDLEGKIIFANERFAEIHGYPLEEVLGRQAKDLLDLESGAKVIEEDGSVREEDIKEVIRKIEEGIAPGILEVKALQRDGTVKYLQINANYIKEDGKVVAVFGIVRDITGRRRMERALRESEEKFRSLFEDGVDPMVILNSKGEFLAVNNRVKELTGFAPEELLGKSFLAVGILTPESTEIARENFVRRMGGGEIPPYEVEVLTKDGGRLPVEINASLIEYEGERADLVVLRDIRERKRAEEEIRRLKEFNENIVENMEEGILLEDKDGYITFINPMMEKLLGYSRGELIGEFWEKIVPPESRERVREEWHRRREGEKSIYEAFLLSKAGQRIPVIISARPLFEDGEYRGAISAFTDITERRRLEEALTHEREELVKTNRYLQTVLDTIPSGLFTVDEERVITSWNKAAERITGYKPEDVIGKSCEVLRGEPCLTECGLYAEDVEKPLIGQECTIIRRDRKRITISKSVDFLRDGHGRIIGGVESFSDITQEKEMERMKMEFVSTVSHEIRTPLTSIKGCADLLLSGDTGTINEEQEEFLKIIIDSADRLTKLINDLLDMQKIESGRLEFKFERVRLDEVLRATAKAFQITAERKGLSFEAEIEEGIVVRADRDRLAQAFANLLSNAVKYTQEGVVRVRARRADRKAVVEIEDTGIGMSAEEGSQLFKKFFRADNPYTREAGGTGLGLSIVKAIIERHGGEISVESGPGVGSTFTVTLPLLNSSE